MKWWCWALLFVLTFMWPYGVYAVLIFISTLGAGLAGGGPIAGAKAPTVVFEQSSGGVNPAAILALVQGSPLGLVWELLHHATFASVVFPAVVAAGLLASDRRTGALQIYFARPVSRLAYLVGKVLAATFFVALTTAIPTFLLWLETVAFGSTATYTWQTWIAPLVIVGASALYALWSVALVLSLSSVMRRPAIVAIVAIGVHLLLEGVGAILANTLDKKWSVIQPGHAIGVLTAPLCGLGIPEWISLPAAVGIGFVLPIGLLTLVWWRLRAVEVAT